MADLAVAVVFAVFIWWFSTGIVVLLNRMSKGAVRLSLALSTVLALAALLGLRHAAWQTDVTGAYCAFTCALLVWGWHELSFLTGWITGPRKTALPAGLPKGQRFLQALRAILWHELGIMAVGFLIIAMTWSAPNQVGAGTFLVLWVMRTSAKLNLFYGVRNLNEAFLPAHLAYLESYFRRRTMNRLFPFTMVAASLTLAWLVYRTLDTSILPAQALGMALVSTMLLLAIVEHALLVLPLNSMILWRWALRSKEPQQAHSTRI